MKKNYHIYWLSSPATLPCSGPEYDYYYFTKCLYGTGLYSGISQVDLDLETKTFQVFINKSTYYHNKNRLQKVYHGSREMIYEVKYIIADSR